jgi:hypothetical protein
MHDKSSNGDTRTYIPVCKISCRPIDNVYVVCKIKLVYVKFSNISALNLSDEDYSRYLCVYCLAVCKAENKKTTGLIAAPCNEIMKETFMVIIT